ncbi:hypothetical protein QTO30_14575 [Yoonia sp. GPGPB17]|uniref:hypothetical protein n=1 Tax=Yoonia sp. GPGPB17 TaxID=3026147 RepID=UPI0030C17D75
MSDRFSDEWLAALKRLVGYMVEDVGGLAEVSRRSGVSRYVLTNFLSEAKSTVPKFRDVGAIHETIRVHSVEKPDTRMIALGRAELDLVFGPRELDRYSDFKTMAQMRHEDLAELSSLASGTFLSFRAYRGADGEGVFVSFVRIFDRFERVGLPTFHMRRKMLSGETVPIDGSISTKNGRLYMLGYDTVTGDMTSMKLLHPGRVFRTVSGFVTGFERSGTAYAVPIVLSRMREPTGFLQSDPVTGVQIREVTGLVTSEAELVAIADQYLEAGAEVLGRIPERENAYLSNSNGA